MRKLILKAGIKEKSFDSLINELDKEGPEYVAKLFAGLEKVHAVWQGAQDIYTCAPEHMWDNYELMGLKDLREQELLKEQLKLLRKACYENLKAKKTKRKKSEKSVDGSIVQPESTGTDETDR